MATALFGASLLSAAGASTTGLIGAAGVFAPSAGILAGSGTLLSAGLTASSAFSSLGAGSAQSDVALQQAQFQSQQLLFQARQASLSAKQEELKGRQEALRIQEQLNKNLASQNAIFSSRGILVGEGSAEAAALASEKAAADDIELARFGANNRVFTEEANAAAFRSDASNTLSQGQISANIATSAGVTNAIKTVSTSLLSGI